MTKMISIVVLAFCCLSAATFVLVALTQLPHAVCVDSEGWGSWAFSRFVGPLIAGGTLLVGVIPSAVLFWTCGRHKRDQISLSISIATLGLVVLTCVLIEPLRRGIIFGRFETLWVLVVFGAMGTALVALVFAGMRRTRNIARRLSPIVVGIALLPLLVLWVCACSPRAYQQEPPPTPFLPSLAPLLLSVVVVWLSRRALPGDAQ